MKINIAFVGSDTKYYDQLWERYQKLYPDLDKTRHQIDLKSKASKDIFIDLYDHEANIIYLDFTDDFEKAFSLGKFINKNNELREAATVGLFEYKKNHEHIYKALNTEMRLFHYKTFEMEDVVFNPISILDVNLAQENEFFFCDEFEEMTLQQPMRIGYVGENHFHVETNSYIKTGEILEIDSHPLIDIMPSRKVYVSHFSDFNLYYNKRFSYDLEFIYIDNDFFTLTNENWMLYKQLKENPDKLPKLDEEKKKQIEKDMQARKQAFGPIRARIDEWLEQRRIRFTPKMLKIMILDHTLDFVRQIKGPIDDFHYSLNVQTKLTHDFYQLDRTRPLLIVIKQDEEVNTKEVVDNIIAKINQNKDYRPYVLVFNTEKEHEDLNKNKSYEHVLYHPGPVSLKEIRAMAKKLDQKLHVTKTNNKVFPRSVDEYSHIFAKKRIEVHRMSESEMIIESRDEIPMWTLFKINKPVEFLLTVVPHREGSEFSTSDNLYRCLIHATGELEKSAIRRMITKAIAESERDGAKES